MSINPPRKRKETITNNTKFTSKRNEQLKLRDTESGAHFGIYHYHDDANADADVCVDVDADDSWQKEITLQRWLG